MKPDRNHEACTLPSLNLGKDAASARGRGNYMVVINNAVEKEFLSFV